MGQVFERCFMNVSYLLQEIKSDVRKTVETAGHEKNVGIRYSSLKILVYPNYYVTVQKLPDSSKFLVLFMGRIFRGVVIRKYN